uniref:Uncharacterized protein n=1 Tax=Glossina palpalis gambiensis TaxID=67801 RepID=A0A1B0BRF2_9MUSC
MNINFLGFYFFYLFFFFLDVIFYIKNILCYVLLFLITYTSLQNIFRSANTSTHTHKHPKTHTRAPIEKNRILEIQKFLVARNIL